MKPSRVSVIVLSICSFVALAQPDAQYDSMKIGEFVRLNDAAKTDKASEVRLVSYLRGLENGVFSSDTYVRTVLRAAIFCPPDEAPFDWRTVRNMIVQWIDREIQAGRKPGPNTTVSVVYIKALLAKYPCRAN
jgi:hypothetical protein